MKQDNMPVVSRFWNDIAHEFDAIRHALDNGRKDDLLVVLADDVTGSWKLITKYRRPDVYRRWLDEQGIGAPDGQVVGWQEKQG